MRALPPHALSRAVLYPHQGPSLSAIGPNCRRKVARPTDHEFATMRDWRFRYAMEEASHSMLLGGASREFARNNQTANIPVGCVTVLGLYHMPV